MEVLGRGWEWKLEIYLSIAENDKVFIILMILIKYMNTEHIRAGTRKLKRKKKSTIFVYVSSYI